MLSVITKTFFFKFVYPSFSQLEKRLNKYRNGLLSTYQLHLEIKIRSLPVVILNLMFLYSRGPFSLLYRDPGIRTSVSVPDAYRRLPAGGWPHLCPLVALAAAAPVFALALALPALGVALPTLGVALAALRGSGLRVAILALLGLFRLRTGLFLLLNISGNNNKLETMLLG